MSLYKLDVRRSEPCDFKGGAELVIVAIFWSFCESEEAIELALLLFVPNLFGDPSVNFINLLESSPAALLGFLSHGKYLFIQDV